MPTLCRCAALIAVALLTACATTPQSRIERDPAIFAALSPEQQQRVKAGSVGVGFDQAAVRLAIGEPDRIVERESQDGTTQVWIYYTVIPGYSSPYCGAGFSYYASAYYCRPIIAPSQYEERTRVNLKDGKVVSVERAR